MKKSLLAVAVAAALPMAAQAQTNVTMYGIADAGVGYVNRDVAGETGAMRVDSGIMSTSRWGVRGSEDLGGGLSAFFNAEAGWNVDEGTGGATGGGLNFQRRSFVGLQGGFGQIFLGREYTPSFYANIANDLFGYGLNGTTLAWNIAGLVSLRYSNAIFWNSPNWGGFQVRTAYGKAAPSGSEYYDDAKSRDNNGEIALLYTGGAAHATAYYRGGRQGTVAPGPWTKIKQYGLGGGYKFGFGRVVAGYSVSDPDDVGAITDKVRMANLGFGVRAGAGEFLIQANQVRYDDLAGGATPKANTLGVGYTYPMSKRTTVYATWGKTWNKDGAALGIGNSANTYGGSTQIAGALGGGVNSSPQAVHFGVRHQF